MTERTLSSADEFVKALEASAPRFHVSLKDEDAARLRVYFEHVATWNKRLHLVAPCPPDEFATRHVLESLLALPFLGEGARVVDVGSGAGLPLIPCLALRPDLEAVLVESSQKKSIFLREVLGRMERQGRARVVAERFEDTEAPEADALTCRALDRFNELLPALFDWSENVKTLLLFGGEGVRAGIERAALAYRAIHVPASEKRFLFVVERENDA